MSTEMTIDALGLSFKTPVLCASGTFGYGQEFAQVCPLEELGGVVTKGISLLPRAGNPPPRICETAAGMLNSIGLANVGLERFVKEKLPFLRQSGTRVVVNFFGETAEEYVQCAERLGSLEGVDALEMNISCPNVEAGGLEFGVDPEVAGRLVRRVCQATDKPVIVKLTPNVTDVLPVARACVEGGCAALSLINTLKGMAINATTRRPMLARLFGGLSGPAIKPVALRLVYQLAQADLGVPLIGMGGICTGIDAAEFLIAGASLVQVGTANFMEPDAGVRVAGELQRWCEEQGLAHVRELIGSLNTDLG